MKYYSELSKIEDSIIRLECISSMMRVVASGIPSTNLEDASNALWHLSGSVEDIYTKLQSDFTEVWELIGNDEDAPKEKHKGGMKKKKMMTDKELS
jgi:hypothetical protein